MMYRQSQQTFIQNSRHAPTRIQSSYQSVLMGYNTDLRNLLKSNYYEKRLNFWQIVCAISSQCKALSGVRETRNLMHWQSMKCELSTALKDSASIPTVTRSSSKYLFLL